MGTPAEDDAETIRRVAVVGAGTMGYGIALAFAVGGRDVTLFDVNDDVLRDARANIRSGVETLADHDHHPATDAAAVLERIEYERSLERAVGDADLVTEAVPEDEALKRDVFADVDEHAPDDALLATNTSSLSVTDLADAVEDPARFVGTHWFNPPHIVPVVEVVRGEDTADATVERAAALLEDVGKSPVVVEKDIPGFIGNRIQSAMAYEAWSLLNAGVASAADIDRAIKGTFGFRLPILGVFEKGDHSGLDIHHSVLSHLMSEVDRGTAPPAVLSRHVEAGDLGVKTGRGVYDWRDVETDAIYEERDESLLSLLDVYRRADGAPAEENAGGGPRSD